MPTDTAVLDADTAEFEEDTADEVEDLSPETEGLDDSPETDVEETPETDDEGDEPDFALMTPEEIKAYLDERVAAARRDVEARTRESERRKAETAAQQVREDEQQRAASATRARADADMKGGLARDVEAGIKEVVDASFEKGEYVGINPDWLRVVVTRAAGVAAYAEVSAQEEEAKRLLAERFPSYRQSAEVSEQVRKAAASNDAAAVVAARLAVITEAVREQLETETEAKVKARMATEQKTKATQAQGARRTNPDASPTPVSGASTAGAGRLTFDRLRRMSTEELLAYEQRPGGKETVQRVLKEAAAKGSR